MVKNGSEGKASACKVEDLGSIPGSGRSPGEGNSNPLQSSCLENPLGGEACADCMGSERVGHDWATTFTFAFIWKKLDLDVQIISSLSPNSASLVDFLFWLLPPWQRLRAPRSHSTCLVTSVEELPFSESGSKSARFHPESLRMALATSNRKLGQRGLLSHTAESPEIAAVPKWVDVGDQSCEGIWSASLWASF